MVCLCQVFVQNKWLDNYWLDVQQGIDWLIEHYEVHLFITAVKRGG